MNESEVQEIITYHKKWLLGDKDGVRANFNKESDFEGIKGKLNEIYRKYYEKLSDKKITSLEEFYDAIMISFLSLIHI